MMFPVGLSVEFNAIKPSTIAAELSALSPANQAGFGTPPLT